MPAANKASGIQISTLPAIIRIKDRSMTFFASFVLTCSASLAFAIAPLQVENLSWAAYLFPVFQTQSDDAALASVRSSTASLGACTLR